MKKEALLWRSIDGTSVVCGLCPHGCRIKDKEFGICGMRQNLNGVLYTYSYGRVAAANVDPVEKKPFYHFLPGTKAFSIATNGCNLKCSFCQNWSISQKNMSNSRQSNEFFSPRSIIDSAVSSGSASIAFTYTEPTVFMEYALDISREASSSGLKTSLVTNGYMTSEAVNTIAPYLTAANIDLKFFRNESYIKYCKATLDPVLDTIRCMKEKGIWVEITTLLIPGVNDADDELRDIANFIYEVDKAIPWHISRFHPDYNYRTSGQTSFASMENAYKIGKDIGLEYIYLGNISTENNTFCPGCDKMVIKRSGFSAVVDEYIYLFGKCPDCKRDIEGIWEA